MKIKKAKNSQVEVFQLEKELEALRNKYFKVLNNKYEKGTEEYKTKILYYWEIIPKEVVETRYPFINDLSFQQAEKLLSNIQNDVDCLKIEKAIFEKSIKEMEET